MPVPPGPVSVTSRVSGRSSSAVTAASSSCLPMSGVAAPGRSARRTGVAGGASSSGSWRRMRCSSARSSAKARDRARRAPARGAEGGERVGLSPGAVEREHLLGAEALAVRVLGDERLELGGDLVVKPVLEVRVDPRLERREPPLLEASGLRVRERLVCNVSESGAPPERERLDRLARRARSCSKRSTSSSPSPTRSRYPGAPGHDPVRAERVPQRMDVHLERVLRAGRRRLSPDRVDQAIDRDRPVRLHE